MRYLLAHRKCSFCGAMLAADGGTVVEMTNDRGVQESFCDAACAAAYRENWSLDEVAERFSKWRVPAPPPREDLDPITLELIHSTLGFIVSQMGNTMQRTAYSPVFAEARDFTCALFDARLELIAQYAGAPSQLGSLRFAVPGAIEAVGPANLQPGDVVVSNDPYRGSPHLPEVCVVRPIFAGGEIVLYAATIAHQADIGGKAPGSMPGDATEVFQEGLIIPPMKLFERGVERAAIFQLLLANIRAPRSTYGDILAMCGSLITAERPFGELVARYGLPTVLMYLEAIKDYAERRFRAAIAKLPVGTFFGECRIDDDGVTLESFPIRVGVAVRGDRIIVDFRGSAAQARGPINAVYAVTWAASLNAILQMLSEDLPNNGGLGRALHVIAPPGTVVNVNYPGALNSGNTESHNLIVEAIMDAMRKAVPDYTCAPSASTTCLVTGGAVNPRTHEQDTFVTWEPAGWGATAKHDGNSAMARYVGPSSPNLPSEVLETKFPWQVKRWELRVDSGGAGQHRGGLGAVREYAVLADEMVFGANSNRGRFAPEGVFGGQPALGTRYWIRRNGRCYDPLSAGFGVTSPDKFSGVRLTRGDCFIVESPGGGGWGDPLTRDRAQVCEDLKQGYISVDQAIGVYGLDPATAHEIAERYTWRRSR